MHLLTTQPPGE